MAIPQRDETIEEIKRTALVLSPCIRAYSSKASNHIRAVLTSLGDV